MGFLVLYCIVLYDNIQHTTYRTEGRQWSRVGLDKLLDILWIYFVYLIFRHEDIINKIISNAISKVIADRSKELEGLIQFTQLQTRTWNVYI